MTKHDDRDDELRDLLTDAVADVEPEYRLDTIKARTQRPPRRRGWYLTGGAILAAASVVTAVNLAQDDGKGRDTGPAAPAEHTAALYFVGDSPAGPRLYREFQQVTGGPLADLDAITDAIGPDDPDYSSAWPSGSFESLTISGRAIEVELGPRAPRPGSLSHMDIQQVIYTAQAALGEDLPVAFMDDGESVDGVLRDRAPQNDVLALVSISDPAEGTRVSGSFVARGRANSHEATVPWEIRDESDHLVLDGFVTALGWRDHLYEWETEPIDVSTLAPGTYTFVAETSDPSGGAEGFGPFTDTRTIIVE